MGHCEQHPFEHEGKPAPSDSRAMIPRHPEEGNFFQKMFDNLYDRMGGGLGLDSVNRHAAAKTVEAGSTMAVIMTQGKS